MYPLQPLSTSINQQIVDYKLPYDILWTIYDFLDDTDRTTFGKIDDDVYYHVFLDVGYQKITIRNKQEADELVSMIDKGLKLYRTEVVLYRKNYIGTYVNDEFVKALAGVHTI